jgi:hypothetical protein
MNTEKTKRFKPDHVERFEKHLEQIQMSRRDDHVIDSMKLTFYAGWAAAMDSMSFNWFEPKAERIKEELQLAVDRLHAYEMSQAKPQTDHDDVFFE